MDFDGCIIVTRESLERDLQQVEGELAMALMISPHRVRESLLSMARAGVLEEDELVSRWHELYAWLMNWKDEEDNA